MIGINWKTTFYFFDFFNEEKMSSVEYLREFVNKRLTAAAEEILGAFKTTIVQYEEELDRQRRLLDVIWKPQIHLHRIGLPQQHVFKQEELPADQQLRVQERSSSLHQEDPEPPRIKEEQEELCTSQEGEQLVLKQETDAFMLTCEESDHSEDQTLSLNPDETLSEAEKQSSVKMPVISSVVSESHSDHQLLSHTFKSQDREGGEHGDAGSTRNTNKKQRKQHHKCNSKTKNVSNPTLSAFHRSTGTNKKSLKCDTCGKAFRYNSDLQRHLMTHTGETPYPCITCEKSFKQKSVLIAHMRIHTGEKPFTCKACGKGFRRNHDLIVHNRRAHTGEKPYLCRICGKRYCDSSDMAKHVRSHTAKGRSLIFAKYVGDDYSSLSNPTMSTIHHKTHTGENLKLRHQWKCVHQLM
ncbi:zinc finger protein with KRAB and SCAN domains 8-like isoform X2 [Plectropomus leopardus]|uniref:zinc finger protein with KRAB and SCAN domains 8-like isoform X2 n=1 Tax=Plectropomus leopardus TaxID=160734 RepID=UPI001C4CB90A|nr:zinc finger protein with KRAB and SCAN domains 8-like isoform X2 [Plectropomus leopardus]